MESKSTFDGLWINGDFKEGKWILKDGTTFEGQFANGQPDGKGKYTFACVNITQEGSFSEGRWVAAWSLSPAAQCPPARCKESGGPRQKHWSARPPRELHRKCEHIQTGTERGALDRAPSEPCPPPGRRGVVSGP